MVIINKNKEVISGTTRNGVVLMSDSLLNMPQHLASLAMLSGITGKHIFHTLDEDEITLGKGLKAYNINKYCAPQSTELAVFNFVSDALYTYFRSTSFVEDLKLKPLTTMNKIDSIVNIVTCANEPSTMNSGELNALVSLADVYNILNSKANSITILATEDTYIKYMEKLVSLALTTKKYNVIVANDNGVTVMMKLEHRLGLTGIITHKTLTI